MLQTVKAQATVPLSPCLKVNNISIAGKTVVCVPSTGCSVPVDPVNGKVGDYESTEEGAEIRVYCFDKLSENVLRCLKSSWYPDPAEINCTISPTPASELTSVCDIHTKQELFITLKQFCIQLVSTIFVAVATCPTTHSIQVLHLQSAPALAHLLLPVMMVQTHPEKRIHNR